MLAELYRAKWTDPARKAYYAERPENFAGPNMSYPIKDTSDVPDAWGLAGQADNPDGVRRKIIAIAKRLGAAFVAALPQTAKEFMEKPRGMDPNLIYMDLPITRVDKHTREVEGRATVEDVDAYKTIFSYDASKKAFDKWMSQAGNIREMHDAKRAIGRAVKVHFDDENKQVIVRARISKSADGDNAWTKIEEGVLRGFSVGARDGVWDKIERNGKTYDYLTQYELVELSIVDNPATPGCVIEVARADGFTSDVLEDEQVETSQVEQPEEERFFAKAHQKAQDALHKVRDGALAHAKTTMQACGCDECNAMADGDKDGDGLAGAGTGSGQGRELQAEITRLKEIARSFATLPTTDHHLTPDIQRRLEAVESKLTQLDEVRSLLSEVRDLTERIAKTPLPGGPVLNGAQKYLSTQPDDHTNELVRAIKSGTATKSQQLEAATMLMPWQQS